MGYRNLAACVRDLEATGQLIRIDQEIDPELEAGAIQRRVYQAGGPAVLFQRTKGCRFSMLGNLFGTLARVRFIFRDTLDAVQALIQLRADPALIKKETGKVLRSGWRAIHLVPRRVGSGPILAHTARLQDLPQLKSWPLDGGAFVTLPLVYSESLRQPGWRHSNLGMYRVQISGNRFRPNQEAGLHYQIHRGIGVHHAEAVAKGKPLRVNVFIGGPPSLTVAAVMPLPEGLPELAFAGILGGHRIPLVTPAGGLPLPAEADFCLTGTVDPQRTLPEGPFGDHLGYYSLSHEFPVLQVEAVHHRPGAIWPFTTVGRPPQEDSTFGAFIHDLTGPVVPTLVPGIRAVHAVDAAGVHPLLLAIGSERYVPYAQQRKPRELLTQANALLGQGQLSLAKYLFIATEEDAPELTVQDIPGFFRHILERTDWRRDLHFQTCTTIDTLDYSGGELNEGSKVVIAVAGPPRRELPAELPGEIGLADGFGSPRLVLPGILVMEGPPCQRRRGTSDPEMEKFCRAIRPTDPLNRFPLVVVVDDSDWVSRSLDNFIWTTFTRSDPAADIYGVGVSENCKHWGCEGSLVIDARRKPHYPPDLEPDQEVERRVDALGGPGGPLHGII